MFAAIVITALITAIVCLPAGWLAHAKYVKQAK
jgi:hypothetical protein